MFILVKPMSVKCELVNILTQKYSVAFYRIYVLISKSFSRIERKFHSFYSCTAIGVFKGLGCLLSMGEFLIG